MTGAARHRDRRAGRVRQEHAGRAAGRASRPRLPRHRPALPRGRPPRAARPAPTRRTLKERWPRPRRSRPVRSTPARLRGEEIGQAASKVAALPRGARGAAAVPAPLRRRRRRGGAGRPRHGHGRCAPTRAVKLFVTATVRGARAAALGRVAPPRRAGLYTTTSWPSCASVTAVIRGRAVAPLRAAPDAFVLDTTDARARCAAFEAALRHVSRQPHARRARPHGRRRPQEPLARAAACPCLLRSTDDGDRNPRSPKPSRDDFAAMLDEQLG